jgi:hypothetical protein
VLERVEAMAPMHPEWKDKQPFKAMASGRISSGGGIEFVRPWAEKVYGIAPEQVVGSSAGTPDQG